MPSMNIEPKSLLQQAAAMYNEGYQGESIDFVYVTVDTTYLKGETAYVAEVLTTAVELVDELPLAILICLLTCTLGWKRKFEPSRDWLFAAVMARVMSQQGSEKARSLLNGLEGGVDPWSTFQP